MSRTRFAALAAPFLLALAIPTSAAAFGSEVLVVSTDVAGSEAAPETSLNLTSPTVSTVVTLELRPSGLLRIAADREIGIQPAGEYGPADDRCTRADAQTVDCNVAGISRIFAQLRGTTDRLTVLGTGLGRPLAVDTAGAATVTGGDENDLFVGANGTGPVTFDGGAGDDDLTGSPQGDTLTGGPGADELDGYSGRDLLLGGEGDDLLVSEAAPEGSSGGDPDDPASSCGGGSDFLLGGRGPNGEDLSGGMADCERRDAPITASISPSGIVRTGSPVTITATSAGTPLDAVTVYWSRCRGVDQADCVSIETTGPRYTPVAADIGATLVAEIEAVWHTAGGRRDVGAGFVRTVRVVAAPATPMPTPTPRPTVVPTPKPVPAGPTLAETTERASVIGLGVRKSLKALTSRKLLKGVRVKLPADQLGTIRLALVLRRSGSKPVTLAKAAVRTTQTAAPGKVVKTLLKPTKAARKALKAARKGKATIVVQTTVTPATGSAGTHTAKVAWKR